MRLDLRDDNRRRGDAPLAYSLIHRENLTSATTVFSTLRHFRQLYTDNPIEGHASGVPTRPALLN